MILFNKDNIVIARYILIVVCNAIFFNYAFANELIIIGASAVPHAEILQQIKPQLKAQGIDLQIKEFNDYVQPNLLTEQKQLDANFFQHRPYLAQFNKEHGTNLVELTSVQLEPIGVYASNNPKLNNFIIAKSAAQLPRGMIVGIPNDTTNEGRALLLLQANGIIKIDSSAKYPTKKNIKSNPYDIVIKELEPAMLPRVLKGGQIDLAVINSNYALLANINPLKDAVFIESADSPYVNIVVVRPDELGMPKMKALITALHSILVRNFIDKTYKGAVIPAF
ncbi:MAG: methionine ABC transporter substrate-binding protein [Burkholderiales bacterium]|nr:methionine ABC transporter substrate-binding protein [Burkholderiales bacterium]